MIEALRLRRVLGRVRSVASCIWATGCAPCVGTIAFAAAVPLVATETSVYFGQAQAHRGESLYRAWCAQCHGDRLEGRGASALQGDAVRSRWSAAGMSADDLLHVVTNQMPYGAPKSLSDAEYLDIVSYLLRENGFLGGVPDLSPATLSHLPLSR